MDKTSSSKQVPPRALRIFLSHASADKVIVRHIVQSLKQRGHLPWFDEASLPFGDEIKRSISERISNSDALILVYSANAIRSRWVGFEIDACLEAIAAGNKVRIIPVLLDDTPLPETLADRRYIAGTDSFPRLVTQVLTSLEGENWHSLLLTREECGAETVLIPRGPVKIGPANRQGSIPHDFLIDKYPVTRRKFMSFCFRGGYQDLNNYSARARLFMEDVRGWLLKLAPDDLLAARFPFDLERFEWLDYPMCWLSAYEAEAYCRWVGGRLPRNDEWDKAARDDTGSAFPWGNVFEEHRCFTDHDRNEIKYKMAFNVYDYAAGQSPHGVFNMAGRKMEYIGELAASHPNDLMDEVVTRGWLDYVRGAEKVPTFSLLLQAGCFPVAGEGHPITFRAVYPLDSSYDALL